MCPDDADQVAHLTAQLGYHVSPETARHRIGSLGDDAVALVAVDEGNLLGWIHGLKRELLIASRSLEIGGLVVAEGSRELGVGRALVSALRSWGAVRGYTQMTVVSNVERDHSHPFYESLGFTRVKTSHSYAMKIDSSAERIGE